MGGGVLLGVPERAQAGTFDDTSFLHTTIASAREAAGGFVEQAARLANFTRERAAVMAQAFGETAPAQVHSLQAAVFDSVQNAFNGAVDSVRALFGTQSTTEPRADLKGAQGLPLVQTSNLQPTTEEPANNLDVKRPSDDLAALKAQIIAELKSSGLVTNTIVEKPTIIERAVERIIGGITQTDLDAQANIINNKLLAQVADLKNLIATRSDQNFSAIALTQKIDNLSGTTLSNVSFSGSVSGITDASIPDNITASNYLPLTGGTIAGDLTITGICTGCGVSDWQKELNFGVLMLTPTTTIPIWAKAGIYASSTLTVNGLANFNSITATSTLNVTGLTTLGNASTSILSVSATASTTNLIVSNQTTLGTLTGLLKAAAGLVTTATAGTDYENPLTFTYPLQRLANAISTAFGTTTANTFSALNIFNAGASTTQLTTTGNAYLATTGGNVGIGTTSPYAKLSVTGSIVAENKLLASYFTATSTTATSTFAGGLNVENGGLVYDFSTNRVGINNTSPTAPLTFPSVTNPAVAMIDFPFSGDMKHSLYSQTYGGDPASNYLEFRVWNGNTVTPGQATPLRMNGSGNIIVYGSGTTCTIGNGTGATNCTSDSRLKTNIMAISGSDALNKLALINGVTFNWVDLSKDQAQQVGVIAQDVVQAFPQIVRTATTTFNGIEGSYYTVDYAALVSPLISGVNALNTRTSFIQNLATSTVLFVDAAGNVGIGTASPDQGKLEVKGGSVCVDTNSDDNASSCIASESDERLKENILTLNGSSSLDTLLKLNPVSFDWRANDPEILKHYPLISRFASSTHSVGLIAQEVQPFFPFAIEQETVGDKDVQYFQLDYTKFIPLLISAAKELHAKALDLENKIVALFKSDEDQNVEISSLKARVDQLEIQLGVVSPIQGGTLDLPISDLDVSSPSEEITPIDSAILTAPIVETPQNMTNDLQPTTNDGAATTDDATPVVSIPAPETAPIDIASTTPVI